MKDLKPNIVDVLRYCATAKNCRKCPYRVNDNSFKCRSTHMLDASDMLAVLWRIQNGEECEVNNERPEQN